MFLALSVWPVTSQEETDADPPVVEQPEAQPEADAANGQNQEAGDTDQPHQPTAEAAPIVAEPVDAAPAEPVADQSDSHTDRELSEIARSDLAAQNAMAEATWQMAYAAWIAVGLTALAVLLLWRTLLYTKEAAIHTKTMADQSTEATQATLTAATAAVDANNLHREALIAEQRAWMVIEEVRVVSDLVWDFQKKEGRLTVTISAKNTGRTAARNVWVSAKLDASLRDGAEVYQEVAKDSRGFANNGGYTIFPQGTMIQEAGLVITHAHLDEFSARAGGEIDHWTGEAPVFIRLFACVDYGLIYENERRQTGCILMVEAAPDNEGRVAMGPAWGTTDKGRISFRRMPFGGDFFAD